MSMTSCSLSVRMRGPCWACGAVTNASTVAEAIDNVMAFLIADLLLLSYLTGSLPRRLMLLRGRRRCGPLRRRKRLARQLLVAHRRFIREHGHDRRVLDHVVALNAIEEVHVRMVRARIVLQPLDQELERRDADVVERHVIGLRDRSRSEDRHAEVPHRRLPLLEDWTDGHVALHPDASDAAGAVVGVEVRRQLRVLRLELHRLRIAEMVADVGARTEQAVLFPAPQAGANRAARLGADRLQDAQR